MVKKVKNFSHSHLDQALIRDQQGANSLDPSIFPLATVATCGKGANPVRRRRSGRFLPSGRRQRRSGGGDCANRRWAVYRLLAILGIGCRSSVAGHGAAPRLIGVHGGDALGCDGGGAVIPSPNKVPPRSSL
jgi:hypothetical protein